mgnify:FL=1
MSTDLTLKYRSASGDAQRVHLGDLRADGTMTLLASEHPAGLRGSAAVQIERDEAIQVINHLRQVFGIGLQELRQIQG